MIFKALIFKMITQPLMKTFVEAAAEVLTQEIITLWFDFVS